MSNFLEKRLKVYTHESSTFVWITLLFFVIFFVTAIFRNYVDTAFIKRYGPSYIPYMLVINALLTFVVMAVIDRLGRKYPDHYLLSWSLGIYAVAVVALFVMIDFGFKIVYPILYQLLYLLDSILLVYLWNIAGDLFDPRQGKRLFPLITAGQVLGTTLGSFSTAPFTRIFGEDSSLILFGIVCMLVSIYMFKTGPGMVREQLPKVGGERNQGRKVSLRETPALIKQYPIIRYLVITGLIPNILLPIFFYQFSVIANHTFTSEQGLISFLSIFRGTTTFITFILLFFVGRLYTSFGITNSSLIQPLNFSVLFAGLSFWFNIYFAAYGQFSTILIQRAIAGPVNKILYSVIPADLLVWSRTFIRGTVLKVGMLSGSLIMIFFKPVLTVKQFSFIALGFAIYWVLETAFFRKHYTRILKQVIAEKQIDFEQIESVRAYDSVGAAMEIGQMDIETRAQDELDYPIPETQSKIDPDIALNLLNDNNNSTRAEAAGSFVHSKDIRAVGKLIKLLGDRDDEVRKAAIESLTAYGEKILPFLEVSLIEAHLREKQSILEVIRLSGVKDFEIVPFLGQELTLAYGNLIVYRYLESMNGAMSVDMLRRHLMEQNEEILSLIFYGLWVYHADMRLMYQALKSETASIAIELIENSIEKEVTPFLIPLIEDIPIMEKIERGRRLLPLIRNESTERLLTFLVDSEDFLTRLLALYVIGDQRLGDAYVPIVESCLTDESPDIRDIAEYALKQITEGADIPMPDIIVKINKLKTFSIFEGMGVRELHAIASVINVETFQPGSVMIKEGEDNSSIYMIVSGKVTIFDNYGAPDEREKATIGEGAFLGELSLFTRMAPNATCVAAELTEVYVLRHSQFQEIMRIYPQIGINLCKFFTMKLRQIQY